MHRTFLHYSKHFTASRGCRSYSAGRRLAQRETSQVPQINTSYANIDLEEFRHRAFAPEKPLLMKRQPGEVQALPATRKWFVASEKNSNRCDVQYLRQFEDVYLPYELHLDEKGTISLKDSKQEGLLKEILSHLGERPQHGFHRINAPLSLFLSAYTLSWPHSLYIAQAQMADLPKQLQDDLPTPRIVQQAGKGDIYDANIWMGTLNTYTPLHKDPNPNLFTQIVGEKQVKLYPPAVGRGIFQHVQEQIGQNSSATFRGEEMMAGPEALALENAVWGNGSDAGRWDGELVADVDPGDALFIPKGWWHSIKSFGSQPVTVSANWWFR
ncbi:Clavaminate synthase-like protein [Glarea lozoyensis ATCC 20868]|uniref:Clavaminate synthase-like protein n=1 Tax=Glarea lozoyensis (strain ATCC 20868 / MF5171) TaxID=1116229 RepID=S3D1Z2_GLAL2|nr:Clavaminate synthase-like protein [Glarea lozoyensis ATCC 20868]EPE32572.1 Clavaminate synthase-like protein [Glarea lozoyensis ATCC 20868]